MPSLPLHPPALRSSTTTENPLPSLLHTPSGLALVEIQGTFHFPCTPSQTSTQVGKLVFPLYNSANDPADTKWMKRVYLYVGKGQRMTGECKKLGKPVGIIRKRESSERKRDADMGGMDEEHWVGADGEGAKQEELEIVEIVRHKIVFSARPEPISRVVEVE